MRSFTKKSLKRVGLMPVDCPFEVGNEVEKIGEKTWTIERFY